MSESLFLKAFTGDNAQVPVWFMRQAGRYLPQYRALKVNNKLEDMFRNPQLAAEITVMPVELIRVDAAILFADILTLPQAMGFDIRFDDKKGPIIEQSSILNQIKNFKDIPHITETIKLVNDQLPKNIPLIGFAGSPFTVLTYLIEGGSSINHQKTLKFMWQKEKEFHQLMDILTDNTIKYYELQKSAGIKVFQLFDTWAGILRLQDYSHFVLPYIQRIFSAINIPSIYFAKNSNELLSMMNKVDADFLSVDHTVTIGHNKTLSRTEKGIQGNLFNGLLYSDRETIKKEVNDILIGAKKHGKFIFNLNHGIFPDIEPDTMKYIVELVHNFNWTDE